MHSANADEIVEMVAPRASGGRCSLSRRTRKADGSMFACHIVCAALAGWLAVCMLVVAAHRIAYGIGVGDLVYY
eukprot:3534511-Prymnesium_polylepis.2